MDSNTIKSETQETKQDTTIKQYDGIIVVALDDDEEDDKKQ